MGAEGHIAVVKGFYEAFGRGDVATILDGLADDFDYTDGVDVGGKKVGVLELGDGGGS